MTVEASRRGASSRRKGADAERAVVAYLRSHGWPHAERAVRTGYRTTAHTLPDPGDITGTPLVCWQVKYRQQEQITQWLDEVDAQRQAAGADHGILVLRRPGHADPGRWWCWLDGKTAAALLGGPVRHRSTWQQWRTELETVVCLLHLGGYGDWEGENHG